jgi:hypothetical protein
MDSDRQLSQSADRTKPHAFVEKLNVPLAVPRPGLVGESSIAPEIAFRRSDAAPGCAVCGKDREDRIHEAAEQAAETEEEHWPL